MYKVLHNFFKAVFNELNYSLNNLFESGSEVSHFIPEPRFFFRSHWITSRCQKDWLKATLKKIKTLINNQTFLTDETDKGETVTSSMDVYKEKVQYDGIVNKLKLIIVVRGYLKNK